jgi:hypothetical protein
VSEPFLSVFSKILTRLRGFFVFSPRCFRYFKIRLKMKFVAASLRTNFILKLSLFKIFAKRKRVKELKGN